MLCINTGASLGKTRSWCDEEYGKPSSTISNMVVYDIDDVTISVFFDLIEENGVISITYILPQETDRETLQLLLDKNAEGSEWGKIELKTDTMVKSKCRKDFKAFYEIVRSQDKTRLVIQSID